MNFGRGSRLTYQKHVFVHESAKPRIDETRHHDEDDKRRYRPDLFQGYIKYLD
jgi:hypothetical protein